MMSQANARLQPIPAVTPLTAAIVGFSRLTNSRSQRCAFLMRARPVTTVYPPILLISPPAQNARPAPVSTNTLISGSSRMVYSVSASSSRITRSSALSASGRFNVIVTIPSVLSTKIVWYSCGTTYPSFARQSRLLDTQIWQNLQSAFHTRQSSQPLGGYRIVGYNANKENSRAWRNGGPHGLM